jgi:hypothetical protein
VNNSTSITAQRGALCRKWAHRGDEKKAFELSICDDHASWNFAGKEDNETDEDERSIGLAFFYSNAPRNFFLIRLKPLRL